MDSDDVSIVSSDEETPTYLSPGTHVIVKAPPLVSSHEGGEARTDEGRILPSTSSHQQPQRESTMAVIVKNTSVIRSTKSVVFTTTQTALPSPGGPSQSPKITEIEPKEPTSWPGSDVAECSQSSSNFETCESTNSGDIENSPSTSKGKK